MTRQESTPNSRGAGADPILLEAVYTQLRALAGSLMAGERRAHTLQATALVHEAYMRLQRGGGGAAPASEGDYFAAAAQAMRRILVEHARARGRVKRGGVARARLDIDDVLDLAEDADPQTILAFDHALRRLEEESPDAAAIVRLRFYAGLDIDQTARALGVSPRTVNRDWTYARAWLYRRLEESDATPE